MSRQSGIDPPSTQNIASIWLPVSNLIKSAPSNECLCCLQCPDSACKQDLLAYLQRIALYCHQLNICSKVKAEVQNLGGELIVSGVSWDLSLAICFPCSTWKGAFFDCSNVQNKNPLIHKQVGYFLNSITIIPGLTITCVEQFDFPITLCLY